jgi:hypothetical protein
MSSSLITKYKNSELFLPAKISIWFVLFITIIILLLIFVFWPKNQSIEVPYDNYETIDDLNALITVTFNNTQRILNAKLLKGSKYINKSTKNVKIEFNPFNKSQFTFYTNSEDLYNQQADYTFPIFISLFSLIGLLSLINILVDILTKN